MSVPNFPQDITKINWEEAMSMIVASIAMEELALSHILNAEGEKLQYVLGTLHKERKCCVSTEQILKVNESVERVLEKIETNQLLLKGKLDLAVKAHQQQAKKVCIYHGSSDYCWNKGCALPWVPDENVKKCIPCCPSTKIILSSKCPVLVNYSFTLAFISGERNITIQPQKYIKNQNKVLATEEIHLCCRESITQLQGCFVLPSLECHCNECELEFVLSAPCRVFVKQATLTLTNL